MPIRITLKPAPLGDAGRVRLINFFREHPDPLVLRRPDIQLLRACDDRSAFVFERDLDGEVLGTGAVFRYFPGGSHREAGAAQVLRPLGGFGESEEEWGFALHSFLHRIRALHSYVNAALLTEYFGVMKDENENNEKKLKALGFDEWNPPDRRLVRERERVILEGYARDGSAAPNHWNENKIWMRLPQRTQFVRFARDLLDVLDGPTRIQGDPLTFRLTRIHNTTGDVEELMLRVEVILLTEQRELLERIARGEDIR